MALTEFCVILLQKLPQRAISHEMNTRYLVVIQRAKTRRVPQDMDFPERKCARAVVYVVFVVYKQHHVPKLIC